MPPGGPKCAPGGTRWTVGAPGCESLQGQGWHFLAGQHGAHLVGAVEWRRQQRRGGGGRRDEAVPAKSGAEGYGCHGASLRPGASAVLPPARTTGRNAAIALTLIQTLTLTLTLIVHVPLGAQRRGGLARGLRPAAGDGRVGRSVEVSVHARRPVEEVARGRAHRPHGGVSEP